MLALIEILKMHINILHLLAKWQVAPTIYTFPGFVSIFFAGAKVVLVIRRLAKVPHE